MHMYQGAELLYSNICTLHYHTATIDTVLTILYIGSGDETLDNVKNFKIDPLWQSF